MAASMDVSAVVAYSAAAAELHSKPRFARAAEKYALAAAAARALGAPDCLVVASLQARRPHCLALRAPRR
jgi:predicted nucleotidyltransferase